MIYIVMEQEYDSRDDGYPIFASHTREKAEAKIKELEARHKLTLELQDFVVAEVNKWMKEMLEPIPPTKEEKDNYEKLTGKSPWIWKGGFLGDAKDHILDLEFNSKIQERNHILGKKRTALCEELEIKHSLPRYFIWSGSILEHRVIEVESDE